MKKLFGVITLILTFNLPLAAQGNDHEEVIRIGMVEYPPHISFNGTNMDAKAYQYVNKVLTGIYHNVEFIRMPTKRALVELKRGHIDLLFPLDESVADVRRLSKPLFRSVPGLCFRKEKFIPFLSATHRFKQLSIGIPAGTYIIDGVTTSGAKLRTVEGSDTLDRGIKLLQLGRFDAFYHPSPVQVYHYTNPLAKEVACSYFYGHSSGVYIAANPQMNNDKYRLIDNTFTNELKVKSYEYYFAERR